MRFIKYLWSKLLKKIRGSAIVNSTVHHTSKIYSGSHIVNSTIGKHTYCGYDCEIINTDVGAFCSIAGNVKIGGAMHPTDWVSSSPVFYSGRSAGLKKKFSNHPFDKGERTIIGNDIWIGNNALIKQGVRIGDGVIIGMGSVVTKDVPDYAIVGGVPAKVIKYRFSETIINSLKEIEWWKMSDEDITRYSKYFNEPGQLIKEIRK